MSILALTNNTTFDSINLDNNQNDLILYDEKLQVNRNILPYDPLSNSSYEELYKINEIIYDQQLSPSIIMSGLDLTLNQKIAIKNIKKQNLSQVFLHEFAKNEMILQYSLSRLSNNIAKVRAYSEDEDFYKIVLDYSDDPCYFEDLLENKYCPIPNEKTLKSFALDILNGLSEIHKNNIIHCDIKPNNFLLFKTEDEIDFNTSYDSYDPSLTLKISDFGFAHIIPLGAEKAYMKYKCGSFCYTAPELRNDTYIDTSVDIWSFGISLYQMAVAYFPTAIRQYKYGSGPIPFRPTDWKDYDFPNLKNLIESCLMIDPKDRISVSEALNHPWFD